MPPQIKFYTVTHQEEKKKKKIVELWARPINFL